MPTLKYWVLKLWTIFLLLSGSQCDYSRVTSFDLMKCSYGDRGSLTATCVNATPNFFKNTLYKFDHLDETLRCINCTLTSIESNTFDLSGNQIKELDLQNSLIETLRPKAFMGLIFLKQLNLSNNRIRSIYPGTFAGTKKITSLDLSKNKISILSESGFAELIELENLILKENEIGVIDIKAFNGLAKLKKLDLSYNSISALNNSLQNMTSLEIINLNNNNINQISGYEFSNLVQLNELDLSNNMLGDSLEITMLPGNQLRKISLAKNKLTTLWFSISHLESLEELDLRYNYISVIENTPVEIMSNLHRLDLGFNILREIKTGWFSGFPQLRSLNCSHNVIQEVLMTGVFSLQNLHSLDLSYNNISDLDYTALISRVPSLAYLRLEHNSLPCDLEQEMEKTFAEDNFKYVLYDNVIGSPKCVVKPVTKSTYIHKPLRDMNVECKPESISASDVIIFIFISLIITAIGILFYLQYLFFRGIKLTGPRRVTSTVQLITSEADQKDDDFESMRP